MRKPVVHAAAAVEVGTVLINKHIMGLVGAARGDGVGKGHDALVDLGHVDDLNPAAVFVHRVSVLVVNLNIAPNAVGARNDPHHHRVAGIVQADTKPVPWVSPMMAYSLPEGGDITPTNRWRPCDSGQIRQGEARPED